MELSLALLTYKAKTYHIIRSRVYPSSAFGGGGELSNSSSIGVAVYGYLSSCILRGWIPYALHINGYNV